MKCPECGMAYVKESPTDRRLHRTYHDKIVDGVPSRPLKSETAVWHQGDDRIVVVTAVSPKVERVRARKVGGVANQEMRYDFGVCNENERPGGTKGTRSLFQPLKLSSMAAICWLWPIPCRRRILLAVRNYGYQTSWSWLSATGEAMMVRTPAESAIREAVDRIATRFHPDKIILFGSRARGQGGPDSDADLSIIMRINGSKRQQPVLKQLP